jgi:hypothetical protein
VWQNGVSIDLRRRRSVSAWRSKCVRASSIATSQRRLRALQSSAESAPNEHEGPPRPPPTQPPAKPLTSMHEGRRG